MAILVPTPSRSPHGGWKSEDGSFQCSLSIAHFLDFSIGHQFRSKVRHLLASSVSPVSSSSRFYLVVSFGRAAFRLDVLNVSLALSAVLGVAYDEIGTSVLADRVFKFAVSSKQVGFLICNLRSIDCKLFKCYFHLWGHGGPNWMREEKIWHHQMNAEWSQVGARRSRPHANPRQPPVPQIFQRLRLHLETNLPSSSVLTGANAIPVGDRHTSDLDPTGIVENHSVHPLTISSAQKRDLSKFASRPNLKLQWRPIQKQVHISSVAHSEAQQPLVSEDANLAHSTEEFICCSRCLSPFHIKIN